MQFLTYTVVKEHTYQSHAIVFDVFDVKGFYWKLLGFDFEEIWETDLSKRHN